MTGTKKNVQISEENGLVPPLGLGSDKDLGLDKDRAKLR